MSTYEKELITLLKVVEKWRHFIILSDHFSLKFLQEQRITIALHYKGITKLMRLSSEIHYKKRINNFVVDALSRRQQHATASCKLTIQLQSKWIDEIIASYDGDEEVMRVISVVSIDPEATIKITVMNGVLRYKGNMWIDSQGNLRAQLINQIHGSNLEEYSGITTIFHRVRLSFIDLLCLKI